MTNKSAELRPNRNDLIRALVDSRYPDQGHRQPADRTPSAQMFAGALENQPLHVLRALAASQLEYERAQRDKKELAR